MSWISGFLLYVEKNIEIVNFKLFVRLLHSSTYREDTWHVLPWDTQRLQHQSTKNKTATSSAKTNTMSLGMWRRIDVFREDSNVFPWGIGVSPPNTLLSHPKPLVSSHKTSTCLPTRHRSQLWRLCPKTLVSSLKTLVSPLKTLASHFWYRPLKTPKRLGGRHLCSSIKIMPFKGCITNIWWNIHDWGVYLFIYLKISEPTDKL